MKTIKPMYRFFDTLYTQTNMIGDDVISDWSHKETPTLVYVVMSKADSENDILDGSMNGIYIAKTLKEAQDELNEWEMDI